jgi:hypothetical protein
MARTTFTILSDGAAWIWKIAATTRFPEVTQVVDLFHAREHIHNLVRILELMLLGHKDEWLTDPPATVTSTESAAQPGPIPRRRP